MALRLANACNVFCVFTGNCFNTTDDKTRRTSPVVDATGVCVFGVPDTQWGEAIKAVVEVPASQGLTVAAVREYVGSRIARYKRPTWVEFTTSLPRNPVGMVDRDAVQSLWGKTPEG